jgi:hypothetical protein
MPELSMIGSGSLSSSGLHGFCRETQSMMEIPGLLTCLSTSRFVLRGVILKFRRMESKRRFDSFVAFLRKSPNGFNLRSINPVWRTAGHTHNQPPLGRHPVNKGPR